jgi:hypothetical protein
VTGNESQFEEFFKSASRFCLATALFGVKQLRDVLSPDDARRAARAFHSVTRVTEGQLDQFWLLAYRAANELETGLYDIVSDLLTLNAFTARGMTRILVNTMQYSASALATVAPTGDGRATLREFRNKLQVFNLFENVDTVLQLSPEENLPLAELIARTSGMDSFNAVWVTEGIGHYYAETVWESSGAPRGLLTEVVTRDLPAKSLVALHAGMGLSLAHRLLARVGRTCRTCPGPSDLRSALHEFVTLCRNNSSAAYVGASYEALGLVTRNLYPHLLAEIDRELSEMDENLCDYFWHGVGRAIYFVPTNYVPLSAFALRALEMTQHEPPHEQGRRNALSGVVWAMVLVNLREPEIIENFLTHCDTVQFDNDAFANGVSSASIIWRDSTGDTAQLEAFCRYQPRPSRIGVVERWETLVRAPCRRALDEYYDALRTHDLIGEVFRYQSLAQLAKVQGRTTENGSA